MKTGQPETGTVLKKQIEYIYRRTKRMKSEVVILSCESYEEELVYSTLKKGIALLGGWETFLKKEEKILLKPNLVRKTEVERAVITHPAVVKGIVRLLQEEGYVHLSCGDSCGVGSAKKVMEGTGMDQILEDYGVAIVDFNEGSTVSYPQGYTAKEFFLAKPVQETDALINLCKMKTHALERVTGGVKNLYGCISGLHKAKGHTKYTNADIFARQLIDLNQLIKPRFCVMDGIVAMDGNGPTSGDPVKMKVLLLGNDPVAIDSVYCHLVHLDPQMVPTNVHGETMGLGTWREENIRLLTDGGEITMQEAVERFGNPDFNVDRKKQRGNLWNRFNNGFLRYFQKKPYIEEDKCKKCGICVEACPVEGKALQFKNGRRKPPVYNYHKCIRCFCCQEMCPHKAIQVK